MADLATSSASATPVTTSGHASLKSAFDSTSDRDAYASQEQYEQFAPGMASQYPAYDHVAETPAPTELPFGSTTDPAFAPLFKGQATVVEVDAADLRKRSLKDELEAKILDSSQSQPDVEATFWNARAGTVHVVHEPGKLQKRKHQINSLAFQAASMETALATQRANSARIRQVARSKYGW